MGAPSGVFRDFRAIATQSKHNASIPKQFRNTNQSLTRSEKMHIFDLGYERALHMNDAVLPELIFQLLGENIVIVLLTIAIISAMVLGIRIVPQSEKHVVERFGRLRSVLGPGINLIVPYLDRVAHKISVLERQLPPAM